MRFSRSCVAVTVFSLALTLPAVVEASTISISSLFGNTSSQGTHNDFPGQAVVTDAFGEDHRLIVEFNLAALTTVASATVSFNLVSEANLPFTISIGAYDGDGVYSQSGDFSIATFATVASFSNGPPTPGTRLTFDVTSALSYRPRQ